jgi:thiol-disulfide isomerase/thioredoxin
MRDLPTYGLRLLLAGVCLLAAACDSDSAIEQAATTETSESPVVIVSDRYPADAADLRALPRDIDSLDVARFSAVLEANRGQVLLVNLWATWCAPCLREIPDLLELEADLSDRGFRLIGISLDDPGSEDKIREFRDEWFPAFRTFHTADEDWYPLVGLLDANWSSILPTSFVLDRDGNVVETLTGGMDHAAFEAAVTPYL